MLKGSQQTAAPIELGEAVEAMRQDFTEMFSDARLPETASSRKDEVEAGFVTMANLFRMLSSISAEYKTAKLQAATPVSTAGPSSPSPPVPKPEGAAAGTEGGAGRGAGAAAAAPAAVESPPVAALSGPRDSNATQEERRANRERTPPPSKAAKAETESEKVKTDDELLGPRKPKLSKVTDGSVEAGASKAADAGSDSEV